MTRPCFHCGHDGDLHPLDGCTAPVKLGVCGCVQNEPDTLCTSHFPMPADPAPPDFATWTHDWTLQGLDANRREHHVCQNCGTKKVIDKEDNTAISPPGRVAPPLQPRVAVLEQGGIYAPNQLFVDALEWTKRQPVQSAMVVLLIAPPPDEAGDPQCEVLWSEADLRDFTLMRDVLDTKVKQLVFERVIPYEEESEDS